MFSHDKSSAASSWDSSSLIACSFTWRRNVLVSSCAFRWKDTHTVFCRMTMAVRCTKCATGIDELRESLQVSRQMGNSFGRMETLCAKRVLIFNLMNSCRWRQDPLLHFRDYFDEAGGIITQVPVSCLCSPVPGLVHPGTLPLVQVSGTRAQTFDKVLAGQWATGWALGEPSEVCNIHYLRTAWVPWLHGFVLSVLLAKIVSHAQVRVPTLTWEFAWAQLS